MGRQMCGAAAVPHAGAPVPWRIMASGCCPPTAPMTKSSISESYGSSPPSLVMYSSSCPYVWPIKTLICGCGVIGQALGRSTLLRAPSDLFCRLRYQSQICIRNSKNQTTQILGRSGLGHALRALARPELEGTRNNTVCSTLLLTLLILVSPLLVSQALYRMYRIFVG